MSAKDRYSWRLECPRCGRTGEIHVSENDHPYAPPETRMTSISHGFYVKQAGGTATRTVLACSNCHEVSG